MGFDFFAETSADVFDEPETTPTKNEKTKKKKPNKKIDYKETMKKALQSPFKCKTHTTKNLCLREKGKNPPTCKSCGFKCEGERGFLSCPETSTCFSICTGCRICPQNHILRNCVSLKQYDQNELYAKNKFKCSNCEVEKTVGV